MKAAVIRSFGGLDAIQVEEVPVPRPGPGEALIRVRACGLNRLDVFARQGLRGPAVPVPTLPHVSGVDAAGEVVELGPETQGSGLKPGDPVVVYPTLFCGRCDACLAGEQSMCASMRLFGEHVWGGLAEYAVAPVANLVRLPDSFPFVKAAAVPAAYGTAWRMVVTVGRLRVGETALVLGAGGGVGAAAVQIARHAGATVIAAARGAARLEQLTRRVGAHHAIDYESEDLVARVMAVTGGRGADLVVNPVGGATWRPAIQSLRPGGRMTVCGATAGDTPDMSIRELYQRHRQILGAPMGNLQDFKNVLRLVLDGAIEPVIHRVLPLERIHEAHRILESREHIGKIVITPGAEGGELR